MTADWLKSVNTQTNKNTTNVKKIGAPRITKSLFLRQYYPSIYSLGVHYVATTAERSPPGN